MARNFDWGGFVIGFSRGGCSRGGGNWGTLRIPREHWRTLGKIRGITTPPKQNPTIFGTRRQKGQIYWRHAEIAWHLTRRRVAQNRRRRRARWCAQWPVDPGYLLYIGDCTTQLYKDYKKPLSWIPMNQLYSKTDCHKGFEPRSCSYDDILCVIFQPDNNKWQTWLGATFTLGLYGGDCEVKAGWPWNVHGPAICRGKTCEIFLLLQPLERCTYRFLLGWTVRYLRWRSTSQCRGFFPKYYSERFDIYRLSRVKIDVTHKIGDIWFWVAFPTPILA